ncbi:MAG: YbhB/YbcL family Raf kinase inhibitor-like protein [Verrucomicrobia bacterium]|nr:YbhB/YbcL family Raf kinase inhibitor-like protein [Verrucomicrobiota bacterium]
MKFSIISPSFKENETIPSKYTCEGINVSPPLNWESAPSGTKSFALIVDDPDAPGGTKDHWVVYNISSTTFSCNENEVPRDALQGMNYLGKTKYTGPCPPNGTHRYFFKLYALKEPLNLPEGATKQEVEQAMESLILDKTQLIGTYVRKAK